MSFQNSRQNLPAPTRSTILAVGRSNPEVEELRNILERAGFEVLSAGDGSEALTILRRTLRPIDLLLAESDADAPGGLQLVLEARLIDGSLPVLLISDPDGPPNPDADCARLSRPFRPQVLVQTVRSILGQAESRIEATLRHRQTAMSG